MKQQCQSTLPGHFHQRIEWHWWPCVAIHSKDNAAIDIDVQTAKSIDLLSLLSSVWNWHKHNVILFGTTLHQFAKTRRNRRTGREATCGRAGLQHRRGILNSQHLDTVKISKITPQTHKNITFFEFWRIGRQLPKLHRKQATCSDSSHVTVPYKLSFYFIIYYYNCYWFQDHKIYRLSLEHQSIQHLITNLLCNRRQWLKITTSFCRSKVCNIFTCTRLRMSSSNGIVHHVKRFV